VTAPTIASLRCSAWARTVGLDPGGTAGSYEGYLVVDLPLPWPRDVSEIPEVEGLSDLLAGSGLRVQATVPTDGGRRRVALYRREGGSAGPGRFAGFTPRALEVSGSLRSAVSELLAGGGKALGSESRQVLVCTHGKRDVCCGSMGTELHASLESLSLPADVLLGRTSHTGGHRFAPTFVVLPEATVWAFADTSLVLDALNRTGDPSAAADHYRGCAGLPGPRVQVLEREVLRRVGWALLSCARWGSSDSGDDVVRLTVEQPDGGVSVWEASVVPGRTLPVPDCGKPLEEAKKSETEWEVRGLRQV
jgi:hypothetical protein